MERQIIEYQTCIKHVLQRYAALTTERASVETIFDDAQMRYLAIRIGWNQEQRIYLCLVHIDICQDHVVIQCNNTEDLIAAELAELGIPREKIVLGFIPADMPEDTLHSDLGLTPSKTMQSEHHTQSGHALAA